MPPRWCQSPSHSQQNFNILGQVQHPGTFPLTHPVTVLDAIALAGGFRDFAKTKSIYVLRQKPDGTWSRLAFNYKEAIRGELSCTKYARGEKIRARVFQR
jgi:hypothetical protein